MKRGLLIFNTDNLVLVLQIIFFLHFDLVPDVRVLDIVVVKFFLLHLFVALSLEQGL